VQIDWTFSDGNSGAQGAGGTLTANGSTTVSITAVNDAPVTDLSGTDDAGTDFSGLFARGDSPLALTDTDATILDADATAYESLSISLFNVLDGANEKFTIAGHTFSSAVTEVVTMTVPGSISCATAVDRSRPPT
jgi:hypothetical protein